MSASTKFWLLQARFGLVLAIGLVLALGVLATGEPVTAAVVAVVTVIVAAVVYASVDRRHAQGLRRGR